MCLESISVSKQLCWGTSAEVMDASRVGVTDELYSCSLRPGTISSISFDLLVEYRQIKVGKT